MTENELFELKNKVETYEKLKRKLNKIDEFLNLPSAVKYQYGDKEKCRMEIIITYGNGSNIRQVDLDEGETYDNIINQLQIVKKSYEEDIKRL